LVEKIYVVVGVRVESKEVVSMELLDPASVPPVAETIALRLRTEKYEELGAPAANRKIKVTIEPLSSSTNA